jgi:hypothetical protein
MALDNVSRPGQMLTVGSQIFCQVGPRRVRAESISTRNRRHLFRGLRARPATSDDGARSIEANSPFFVGLNSAHLICAIKEKAMQNGRVSTRRPRPVGSFVARSKGTNTSASRSASNGSQIAQRSYERYLALAQEESRSGNVVGAENYYQHAEHYFRLMSANRAAT